MEISRTSISTLTRRLFLFFAASVLTLISCTSAFAQQKEQVVRMAKIIVDSAQLESYQAALKEGIETAIRAEPGVLTLYAVSEKNNPTHITVFEIYANAAAYKTHLETPHFRKYKNGTKEMIKSLELIDVVPIALGTKWK